jgi:protein-disulfide isomerase
MLKLINSTTERAMRLRIRGTKENRSAFIETVAAIGLTVLGVWAVADSVAHPLRAEPTGVTVPIDQLMAENALPDIALGKADAPVTIIEYASMTCSHCAAFYAQTFPELKSKYIDTGKVRFILREFPLDPLATAGFMLARCSGPDKRNAMVDLLFAQQKNWAFTEKPIEALANIVKQTGMTQEAFEACLKDQALYEKVNDVRNRASEKFSINATPTFFINGRKQSGEIMPDQLDKLLEPMLKG